MMKAQLNLNKEDELKGGTKRKRKRIQNSKLRKILGGEELKGERTGHVRWDKRG
jgi:hypothetical protein